MKKSDIRTKKLAALVLAMVMAVALAACGSGPSDTVGIPDVGGTMTDPAPEGLGDRFSGWGTKDDKDDDKTSTAGEAKDSKKMTEKSLKPYGELVTVIKSVSKPTKPDSKNVQDTKYGKVDWSMAPQGYIEFTAKGAEHVLVLQGPGDSQTNVNVAKDETVRIALVDGAGKYQYAIGNLNNTNKTSNTIKVLYKNSFEVKTIDSELACYLVSTPYGDYENAPNAVKQANELWNTKKTQLENVKAITKWITSNMHYDKTLKSGTISVYVDPDKVIENGGGVCNEMSKLLTTMLRSQGIPAYMQNGTNRNGQSHGWVMAWIELSNETKNGTTTSTGTWVTIEATGGGVLTKSVASKDYTPGNIKG